MTSRIETKDETKEPAATAGAATPRKEAIVPARLDETAEHHHILQVVLATILLGRKDHRLTLTNAQMERALGRTTHMQTGPAAAGWDARAAVRPVEREGAE